MKLKAHEIGRIKITKETIGEPADTQKLLCQRKTGKTDTASGSLGQYQKV